MKPVFKEAVWGGRKLRDDFGYEIPSDSTGECWGIGAHKNGDCDKPLDTGGDGSLGNTPKRAKKEPGRNDPCPCGSGKKYKNCCGKNK